MSAPAAARSGHLAGLVGPRGLGSIVIVVLHTFALVAPTLTNHLHLYVGGQVITYFFVLSGFLIYLPYVAALAAGRPLPSLSRFATHRLRRILPTLVVTFLVADLVLGAVYVANETLVARPRSDAGTGRILDPLLVLSQVTGFNNVLPSQLQTGITPTWSLTTELCFYAVVPLIAWWTRRLVVRSRRPLLPLLVPIGVLGAVGLLTRLLLEIDQARSGLDDVATSFGPTWQAVLTRSLLGQADTFAVGMAVAVAYVWWRRGGAPAWDGRRVRRWSLTVLAVSLVAMLVAIKLTVRFDATAAALAGASAIVLTVEPAARGRAARLPALVDCAPLWWLGEISLSTYLWHYPVLIMVVRLGWVGPETVLGAGVTAILVAALTIVVGVAGYVLVERPARATS